MFRKTNMLLIWIAVGAIISGCHPSFSSKGNDRPKAITSLNLEGLWKLDLDGSEVLDDEIMISEMRFTENGQSPWSDSLINTFRNNVYEVDLYKLGMEEYPEAWIRSKGICQFKYKLAEVDSVFQANADYVHYSRGVSNFIVIARISEKEQDPSSGWIYRFTPSDITNEGVLLQDVLHKGGFFLFNNDSNKLNTNYVSKVTQRTEFNYYSDWIFNGLRGEVRQVTSEKFSIRPKGKYIWYIDKLIGREWVSFNEQGFIEEQGFWSFQYQFNHARTSFSDEDKVREYVIEENDVLKWRGFNQRTPNQLITFRTEISDSENWWTEEINLDDYFKALEISFEDKHPKSVAVFNKAGEQKDEFVYEYKDDFIVTAYVGKRSASYFTYTHFDRKGNWIRRIGSKHKSDLQPSFVEERVIEYYK